MRADAPGAVINPAIYGQFAEHLGGLDLRRHLGRRELRRFPTRAAIRNDVAGCAEGARTYRSCAGPAAASPIEYHWQDGVGPRETRPGSVNTHWGGVVEDNSFGTHEFMDFVRTDRRRRLRRAATSAAARRRRWRTGSNT